MSTRSKKKKLWPAGKPIPNFKNLAEEEAFWQSHDFEDGPGTKWEELTYEPQATRQPRTHVYRVRLDDREMAKLQTLAKTRGVPASVVLRELVREASGRRPA
ncbi:MAG: CopG family antitoxin [Polyangiaceae bacterium]|jgi:hypothetical protein